MFLLGLVSGGVLLGAFNPAALTDQYLAPTPQLAAGLMVGFGARLAGGCTSGHGLCGVGRLSFRSVVATCLFTVAGLAAGWILRRFVGGA